jgi:hypothetical protein
MQVELALGIELVKSIIVRDPRELTRKLFLVLAKTF